MAIVPKFSFNFLILKRVLARYLFIKNVDCFCRVL